MGQGKCGRHFFRRNGGGFEVEGAVAVENLVARDGRDAVARNDDADEVHGIGGGDGDDGGAVAAARDAERLHGFGERVLLASEAREEAAAADLAASFEAAEDVEKVAPFGSVGFAGECVSEEDSEIGRASCRERV